MRAVREHVHRPELHTRYAIGKTIDHVCQPTIGIRVLECCQPEQQLTRGIRSVAPDEPHWVLSTRDRRGLTVMLQKLAKMGIGLADSPGGGFRKCGIVIL